jgi:hypothetical protein
MRSDARGKASGHGSRRRPRCPTDPDHPQRTLERPSHACRLTSVSIFVSTGPAADPNGLCLRAIVGSDTRNHNPRVAGSDPSSGTQELPSKRLDRDPRTRTTGSAWAHRWGHPHRGSPLAACVLAGLARAHTRARHKTGPPHVGGVAVPLRVVGRGPLRLNLGIRKGTGPRPIPYKAAVAPCD